MTVVSIWHLFPLQPSLVTDKGLKYQRKFRVWPEDLCSSLSWGPPYEHPSAGLQAPVSAFSQVPVTSSATPHMWLLARDFPQQSVLFPRLRIENNSSHKTALAVPWWQELFPNTRAKISCIQSNKMQTVNYRNKDNIIGLALLWSTWIFLK